MEMFSFKISTCLDAVLRRTCQGPFRDSDNPGQYLQYSRGVSTWLFGWGFIALSFDIWTSLVFQDEDEGLIGLYRDRKGSEYTFF